MTAAHTAEHEQRLAAHLVGDLPAEGLAAQVDACGECRAHLREARVITGWLDRAADEERAVVTAALDPRAAPSTTPTRPMRGAGRRAGARLAAAALLVLFVCAVYVASRRAGTPEPPIVLGSQDLECIAPSGHSVDPFHRFVWRGSLPPGGWYEVLVFASTDDVAPLARSQRLESATWDADPSKVERWPAQIRWEVRAYDATGARTGSCGASASRSR